MAGYQVEYGSTPYLLFMLGEYVEHRADVRHDLPCCSSAAGTPPWPTAIWPAGRRRLASLLGLVCLRVKTVFLFFMIAMVKAIVPRYRYDQLMRLGWKVFLPTSLVRWSGRRLAVSRAWP